MSEDIKPEQPTEEQKQAQEELQQHFNKFKKRMKTMSKSELVAIIWEQGMRFQNLQAASQELLEENKELRKESSK